MDIVSNALELTPRVRNGLEDVIGDSHRFPHYADYRFGLRKSVAVPNYVRAPDMRPHYADYRFGLRKSVAVPNYVRARKREPGYAPPYESGAIWFDIK